MFELSVTRTLLYPMSTEGKRHTTSGQYDHRRGPTGDHPQQDKGITNWEVCPFWLCMADTRSVRPSGLRRKLKIVIGGYTFEISAMVLALDVLGAYALLIGCPWLHLANIKPNWQHNNIRFHRGRGKIRVPMQESTPPMKAMTPLYVEEVHIFKGLEEEELENYLEENLRIVPLFDIDVIEIARAYATPAPVGDEDCTPDMKALMELRRAQDAFD